MLHLMDVNLHRKQELHEKDVRQIKAKLHPFYCLVCFYYIRNANCRLNI